MYFGHEQQYWQLFRQNEVNWLKKPLLKGFQSEQRDLKKQYLNATRHLPLIYMQVKQFELIEYALFLYQIK
jgi:hypothetical protein